MSSDSPSPVHELTSVIRNKRRNTAVSCNECRRLKLRCSREPFPCTNCVKKGCGVICPDGSLTTGKGNRFVLANTEELHDKIDTLSDRVRKLEDALAETHTSLSNDPHPLLRQELLAIKKPLERDKYTSPSDNRIDEENAGEEDDTMASLSISENGRTKFFGTTANSWFLLDDEEDETPPGHYTPPFIPSLSHASPFTTSVADTAEKIYEMIMKQLPTAAVARKTAEIYFAHAAWMYTPISESEFEDMVFSQVYRPGISSIEEAAHPHLLAILLVIMALGTLMDTQRESHSREARHYYQLSRSALSLRTVLEEQSVDAVRALLLLCHYMFLDNIEGARWVTVGLAVKLAQSVGLHRDSGFFNLSAEETATRRSLMWELYTYDSLQSLTYGRPPTFASMCHVDCQMAWATSTDENGIVEMSFAAWKHRFSSECLSVLHDRAFGAKTPTYKVLQELDSKVRNYYVPPSLQVPGFGGQTANSPLEKPSLQLTLQQFFVANLKEITLFYMHRGFFLRAVDENAGDPLASRFSPSVLAVYNGACTYVGLMESLFSQQPRLAERMWFFYMHLFSCAIVLGAIASKPRMKMAPAALSHLNSVVCLFEQVTQRPRATKIVSILRNLQDRARSSSSNPPPAVQAHAQPQPYPNTSPVPSFSGHNPFQYSMASPSSPHVSSPNSYPTPSLTDPGSSSSSSVTNTPFINHTGMDAFRSPMPWDDLGQMSSFGDMTAYPKAAPSGVPANTQPTMQYDLASFGNLPPDEAQAMFAMPASFDGFYDLDASWQEFVEQMKNI